MKIVTSICVDEETDDNETLAPQIGTVGSNQRNIIYWKCATVFLCTSIRCNPHVRHLLYTNDRSPVTIENVNIVKKLIDLGVEICYLPFRDFKPPRGFSRTFKNAFYKLDVINTLGKDNDSYSILLDSDCVWAKHDSHLFEVVKSDKILLLDVYKRVDASQKFPHNLSRKDMGKLYKQIDSSYQNPTPIRFGGEIIGGSSKNLNIIAEDLERSFKHLVEESAKHTFRFVNGQTMFDGVEFLASFVYSKNIVEWNNADTFIKRIWTLSYPNNVKPSDLDLAIWHLPAEKKIGISSLFDEAIKPESKFWRTPINEFNKYLGEHVGIPKRKYKVKGVNDTYGIIKGYVKRLVALNR